MFPELYAAFIDGVPFPDHTRPDGVRNLVSHFAKNGVIPDLGGLSHTFDGLQPHRHFQALKCTMLTVVRLMISTTAQPGFIWMSQVR
jgi:hypothetical protein